jgi:hypothetical protein
MNEAAVSLRPDERGKTFGLVAVTVDNRDYHHLTSSIRFDVLVNHFETIIDNGCDESVVLGGM